MIDEAVRKLSDEITLATAAAIMRDRAHTLRVQAIRTNGRERNGLRDRAARLERAARLLDEESARPQSRDGGQ